jgi:hypothetical protein
MPPKSARLNTVGQTYHDFQVTKVVAIPELQCLLRELVHLPTGALVMDISNSDPENMFCLSFKTWPENSNGVAHVLEHTVLCGSEKYPVKDPFFSMSRRSLNTFMNALTGSDFTCYPAASQIPKDFYNLLEVYIDAVFKPNLNELSFLQEGHRLEFAIGDDPTSPLEHKGIVYNEMKGALASGHARLAEAMNLALFPNVTYGVNSGGDPKDIPKLTYTELCAFFEKYYHPSRCLFFFYGNMPLEGHLDFIAKHALKDIKKLDPLPSMPIQPRFDRPIRLELDYPIPPDEDLIDKALISFGWLTCHILKQEEVLAISLLDIILMDTDASPLKRALLNSGLCKQASAGLDVDICEVPFTITLTGCDAKHADQLEKILRNTLEQIIQNGIPLELIENAMHQLEFYRSEITGNSAPFGLSLFFRSGLLKQHDGNPEDGLMIHSLFDQLRRTQLANPHYLTDLIRKYLLDNTHFVRIVMSPNKHLAEQELKEEKDALELIRKELAPGQEKQIIQKAADLTLFQKKQEDDDEMEDVLPKITLDDIPKSSRDYILNSEKLGQLQVFHHSCFTNEIVYADLVFDMPAITEKDLPLVRLFTVLVPQMGCRGRNYSENLEYIQANTGGVGAFTTLNRQALNSELYVPTFCLRGKALYHKTHKLFPLLHDLTEFIDFFDKPRLKEVLLKHYTVLRNSLNQNALRYAINLSASALDVPSRIADTWYGLEYYWMIKKLAENFEAHAEHLIEKLQMLHRQMMGMKDPHLVLTCDSTMYDKMKSHGFYGLQNLISRPCSPWKEHYTLPIVPSQGRVIASPIAFTAHVFKTLSYIHPDTPALHVAAGLFDNLVLHPQIRERGGAYGGGSSNNALAGNFYFYAYRDPNISSTLQAFETSIQAIASGDFDENDLEEAKLEVIQGLDSPVAPGSRGDLAYTWLREGRTLQVRQSFRNRLLALSPQDIISAVNSHIVPQNKTGATVVFAGTELLERENKLLIAQGRPPLKIESI